TLKNIVTLPFKNVNDCVVLLGKTFCEMGGSEYYHIIHGVEGGVAPKVNMQMEKNTISLVLSAIQKNYVNAVHDCSKGGLGVAISLMSIRSNYGVELELSKVNVENLRLDELLFSESHSRFIVTSPESTVEKLFELANNHGVPAYNIGKVTGSPYVVFRHEGNEIINCDLKELRTAWEKTIPSLMGR
ncbi:MAG: AIR synthase-related protein, partial [Candidatus Jordarchaeaceae archaeon]